MSDNDDYQRGDNYAAPARERSTSPGARRGEAYAYPQNGAQSGGDTLMRSAEGDRPAETQRERDPRERDPRERDPREREPRGGERQGRADEGATNPGNNLHVSGLALKVEQRDLEEFFSTAGKIHKASVMYDPHSRESRGFGFVMMETPEEAVRAIEMLDKKEFMGKIITVVHARRARARTPTPGRYFGPPKAEGGRGGERPYQPRSFDGRYAAPPPRPYYDDRRDYDRAPRHEERRDYGRYDDRAPRGGYYGGDDRAPPPRSGGGEYGRSEPRYDDRRRDDRGYGGGGESRSRY